MNRYRVPSHDPLSRLTKDQESSRIACEIDAFRRSGGKIKRLDYGLKATVVDTRTISKRQKDLENKRKK
jgi:hypothetical protein